MYKDKLVDAIAGVTFDDILLMPSRTNVEPNKVDISTQITKDIRLHIPVVSSPMDTVTEEAMAIALARLGGLGIVHRNIPAEKEAEIVEKVKREESIVIKNVMTVSPTLSISRALDIMDRNHITGLPVVDDKGKLLGIITIRDIRFYRGGDGDIAVSEFMTREVITAPPNINMEKALEIMHEHRIEKLPVVDSKGRLVGLITAKDILKRERYPGAVRDKEGRLLVGAAVGPFDIKRAVMLEKAGTDVLVIDSAHAHNTNVMASIKKMRKAVDVPLIGGNIATAEAAEDLIALEVDALRVGLGPGSICTTRIIAGVGVPQIYAVADVADVAAAHGIPVIADGGIRYSGDIAKAIAVGADAVMIGGLLAGTEESPGRELIIGGRKYKYYRGMGSEAVMKTGLSDRYPDPGGIPIGRTKLVPEGVEGAVPYKGRVDEMIAQLIGGLKAGMGYVGAASIADMKNKARLVKISTSAIRESHPHDIRIISEAPNYPTSPNEFL